MQILAEVTHVSPDDADTQVEAASTVSDEISADHQVSIHVLYVVMTQLPLAVTYSSPVGAAYCNGAFECRFVCRLSCTGDKTIISLWSLLNSARNLPNRSSG